MKVKNTLSLLLVPIFGLAATASLAAISGPVQFTVTNNTACYIASDPYNNCSGPLVIASGSSQTFICQEAKSFELYYNPDSKWNHSSSLAFNHYITPSYSYFMQSYGFQTGTFDGTKITYDITPTQTADQHFIMTGATSIALTDDRQAGAQNILTGNRFIITVTGSSDTCYTNIPK